MWSTEKGTMRKIVMNSLTRESFYFCTQMTGALLGLFAFGQCQRALLGPIGKSKVDGKWKKIVVDDDDDVFESSTIHPLNT